MANQVIKGKDLMLFDSDGHSYAYATNHTFSLKAETTDISSKDHGIWGGSQVSKYTWEITSENLFTSEEYDGLFTKMLAGTAIDVKFGLKTTPSDPTKCVADGDTTLSYWTAGSSYYTGKVIITSLQANANNGDNATFSVTLTGTGSVKKVAAS